MLKTFRTGGIHIPEHKITAGVKIVEIPAPKEIVVTFSQHIGELAKCVVSIGDKVKKYDLIARASSVISANIHTSISGTVKKIDSRKTAFGYPANTVTIIADDEDIEYDKQTQLSPICDKDIAQLSAEEIIAIIDKSGIVGLGGAAFPTKVKVTPPEGKTANVLIINGVECEPYLTNDHALMLEHPEEIIEGIRLLMKAAKVRKAVIAIENNKPDAIAAFMQIVEDDPKISVMPLMVKYPQGGEKQLIDAILNKEVPTGALPITAGALVQNVATIYAVHRAVRFGEPLVSRIITVTGDNVVRPGNYQVSIGTPLEEIITFAGGIPDNTGKIVLGGPMMGKAIVSVDAPMLKGISGILMMAREKSVRHIDQPCIRCGSCVTSCPMGLEPFLLMALAEIDENERAEKENIRNCIECGCCAYSCPANRPILDYIKLGKEKLKVILRNRIIQK